MGTWGPHNFDSDTAADHLGELTASLVKEIAATFENPTSLEPDEYGGTVVPCNIELLVLLWRQRYVGVTLPDAATAARWKKTYLDVWDRKIDGLDPNPKRARKPDPAAIERYQAWKKKRRAALVKTFNDLARCIERENG
jgi:hypothetical protein